MASEPTAVANPGGDDVSKSKPPTVVQIETAPKDGENGPTEDEKGFGQARTPKHANKTKDEDGAAAASNQKNRSGDKHDDGHHYGGPRSHGGNNFPPPRPYEGRPLGGNGAFQPHEPRRQPPPPNSHPDHAYYTRSPMQVSPGGGANGDYQRRYYSGSHGRNQHPRMEGGYPPHGPPSHHHHGGYYERGGYSEYGPHGRPPAGYEGQGPPSGYRGQYPPQGPPGPYPSQSYQGYPPGNPSERGNPPPAGWGPHPPPYPPHGQGGQYPPREHYQGPEGRYPADHHGQSGNFSRAVSSSFDRSVKSRSGDEKAPGSEPPKHGGAPPPADLPVDADASLASDDMSWRQLKQVHSVDDSAIRERLQKAEKGETEDDHIEVERQPASNSSSLTNSPTEGPERLHGAKKAAAVVAAAAAAAAAQPSSLDSLASISSAQAPLETMKNQKSSTPTNERAPSPGSESASLDLMKCASGSSGLLHLPPHQRNITEEGELFDGKRAREEERGDTNTAGETAEDELRRAPSDSDYEEIKPGNADQPPTKRVRLQDAKEDSKSKDAKSKASPLSITCSPSAKAKEPGSRTKSSRSSGKPDYHSSPQPMEGYFDKPPTYSYSMDSAPSLPRDAGHRKQPSYPSLPPRPGSSSSSTLTPAGPGQMQIDGRDGPDPVNAVVPSIASWDIQQQDSFGAGSVGGGQGLTSSFSFQDYPMLSASESNLGPAVDHGTNENPHGGVHDRNPHYAHPNHPPLESRNQSFDHYHGDGRFHRTDSMDVSYNGRSGYQQHGHSGSFPPHAPSWATAGSGASHPSGYHQGPPPAHYSPYGGRVGPEFHHPGGVMRNYSHDSAHRSSPPGRMHPGQRAPPGFQPPPEFAAPHNPHLSRRPPPAVYIMSSSQNGGHQSNSKRGNGVFSWSKDDDIRLSDIMKKYKNPRDWEPIAKEHGCGKTAKECHERWIRYLKPGVRKGQWTDHEDAIVIEAVSSSSEQPFTRWSDLAQRLPGRVGKQIRDRWVNHLNPNINHLPFSREDDMLLWDGHKKLGKRWVEISTKLFNSSRSENHIKNRWYSASFKKFISNEFGADAYTGNKTKGKDETTKSKKKGNIKTEDDPAMQEV